MIRLALPIGPTLRGHVFRLVRSALLAAGWLAASSAAGAAQASHHDIVVIVADDQSWHMMQFMPRTNTLIGDAGVRFRKAFVSTPLCCPSRASILSGLYSHNHTVLNNFPPLGGATHFDDRSTVATWLESAGYATGLFGQYMKDYHSLEPWPYVPPGWTEWRAHKEAGYYDYYLVENGSVRRYGSEPGDYSVDVLARKAVRFIESTPADTPLFVYFAPYAPHTPAQPAPGDETRFQEVAAYRSPAYDEADMSDKPRWLRDRPRLTRAQRDSTDALYRRQVATLQGVDRAVAGIVDALARTGRLANTAIVYTSDNGLSLGDHRWLNKSCVYEGCIRVPLLVRAPGVLPRLDDHLMLNVDIAPTIAEWAGVRPATKVDGKSFADLLSNADAPWRKTAFLELLGFSRTSTYHRANFQAVRTPRYLYAEYMNGDRELYDLERDPYELENVVSDPAYAEVASRLGGDLERLRSD